VAIESDGPVALALTRQNVPVLDPKLYPVQEGVSRGAYVLSESPKGRPGVILVASGSEVSLALDARRVLGEKGIDVRVVSMPSWELFAKQTHDYRESVLPHDIPKLAIEAGVTLGWRDHVGDDGDVIGLDRFGASAPGPEVMKNFGFDVDRVVEKALSLVNKKG
jgi:transketolase